jgi:hypothetical protein
MLGEYGARQIWYKANMVRGEYAAWQILHQANIELREYGLRDCVIWCWANMVLSEYGTRHRI